jgi:hypothetical protein
MTRKKKKKLSSSKKTIRRSDFAKIWMPNPKGATPAGKLIYVEAKHLNHAYNVLFGQVMPATKANKKHLETTFPKDKRVRWTDLIIISETLGFNAGQLYTLLHQHFRKEAMAKRKVAWLSPLMVQQLLKKINKWGGAPKSFSEHRNYINSWCRKNGVPLFTSSSNFSDWITNWKAIAVPGGKRDKSGKFNKERSAKESLRKMKKITKLEKKYPPVDYSKFVETEFGWKPKQK